MAEINNLFGFIKNLKMLVVTGIIGLAGYGTYLFQNEIGNLFDNNKLELIEEVVQLTDNDILSTGYWKLNKDLDRWECVLSSSVHEHHFCGQTKSFANDDFVKDFQLRLEREDTIIAEVNPKGELFEQYWVGVYSSIFGHDRSEWKDKTLYVIYFQIGDTDDLRRVIYTLDKNDANEGRQFTNHYLDVILKEIK